jgi:hypothetical protein
MTVAHGARKTPARGVGNTLSDRATSDETVSAKATKEVIGNGRSQREMGSIAWAAVV